MLISYLHLGVPVGSYSFYTIGRVKDIKERTRASWMFLPPLPTREVEADHGFVVSTTLQYYVRRYWLYL
jgi:hypothetical protein